MTEVFNALVWSVVGLALLLVVVIFAIFGVMWAHDERPWRGPRR